MEVNRAYNTSRVVYNERLRKNVLNVVDIKIPPPKTKEEIIKEQKEAEDRALKF